MYCEDVDLSLKLRSRGDAIAVVPDARVHHSYAFVKGDRKWRLLERNRWATVLRTYPGALLVAVLPAMLAAEVAVWLVAVRGGWGRMKGLATLDVIRALPAPGGRTSPDPERASRRGGRVRRQAHGRPVIAVLRSGRASAADPDGAGALLALGPRAAAGLPGPLSARRRTLGGTRTVGRALAGSATARPASAIAIATPISRSQKVHAPTHPGLNSAARENTVESCESSECGSGLTATSDMPIATGFPATVRCTAAFVWPEPSRYTGAREVFVRQIRTGRPAGTVPTSSTG